LTREITTIKSDGVLQIDFLRPTKKNAFTKAMYQDMADALEDAARDDAIRAILFAGQPDIFTAGNDVEDFLKNPPSGEDSPVFQFLHQISHAEKPIVAAVRGAAIGIGTTLLLHCDLVYAADNARFSLPFVSLGLVPEAASSMLLPRLFGYQGAAEKLFLGETFNAEEAHRAGLVNKILPVKEVLEFAQHQARKLAALPAASLRATKKLMKHDLMPMIKARMDEESELFRERLKSPEAKEALSAFLEKRKPDFSQFA
jgi:enoyl-CoA hydratase/carnithine racemase